MKLLIFNFFICKMVKLPKINFYYAIKNIIMFYVYFLLPTSVWRNSFIFPNYLRMVVLLGNIVIIHYAQNATLSNWE